MALRLTVHLNHPRLGDLNLALLAGWRVSWIQDGVQKRLKTLIKSLFSHLGPILGHLGSPRRLAEDILGHLRPSWGGLRPSWNHLLSHRKVILRPSWEIQESPRAFMVQTWATVGPFIRLDILQKPFFIVLPLLRLSAAMFLHRFFHPASCVLLDRFCGPS